MKKIYIGTSNEGKIKEIMAAFGDNEVEFLPLEVDFDELEDQMKQQGIRDMATISRAKAKTAFEFLKKNKMEPHSIIVDDAGIYFEKLGDEPGIDTKNFVKRHGGIEGVKKAIKEGDRAYFQNVISYMDDELSDPKSFVGKMEGRLSPRDDKAEIENGMPFNHVFIPDGYNEFMYKIPLEARKKFSHRFKAAKELKAYLKGEVNEPGLEVRIK